jgi:hypothetical protein
MAMNFRQFGASSSFHPKPQDRSIVKQKTRTLATAMLALLVGNAWSGNDTATPTSASQAGQTTTNITRWADRCTNFTSNGWAFKAPRNFLQWLEVFSDPGIYLEFGRRGLDPRYLVASLDSLLDPGTPRNYLEWTNPDIYNKWLQAAAEPGFYTAVNSILFDPGRMMRWVMLPLDGKAWELVGTAINPVTWLKWLNAPLDPRTQALFAKAANPETAQRWLDALGDPKNTPWLHAPTTNYGSQSTILTWPDGKPEPGKIRM